MATKQKKKGPTLLEIADSLFTSRTDVDALQSYLEEITGDKVSMGNLTVPQTRGLIKTMLIDRLYLGKVPKGDNVLRKFTGIVVETSKGKEAYGLEAMRDILRTKRAAEEETRLEVKNGAKEAARAHE
ncbi:unnamed protein product [marine sediment metagenome]|uniref:Uncharacterized protein n=1 Tax=marine sediment metagenome TaxID=412755 RepID=X1LAB9_9ZZZZ